jgi:hypothetical protein
LDITGGDLTDFDDGGDGKVTSGDGLISHPFRED